MHENHDIEDCREVPEPSSGRVVSVPKTYDCPAMLVDPICEVMA